MRNSISKLLHKFALIQKDYSNKVESIEHSKVYKKSELEIAKNPKAKKTKIVKTVQKIMKSNVVEKNLKKLWNNTPAPERIKLRKIICQELDKKGIHYAGVQPSQAYEGS